MRFSKMATRPRKLSAAAAALLGLAAISANADEISDLRKRLDEQEQRIKVLERKLQERDAAGSAEVPAQLETQQQQIKVLERRLELNDEAAKSASASAATVKAGPKGFSIQSADNANVIKLRGTLHFDGRYFLDDTASPASDTWLLRRVRPIIEGTLGGIWDFRFMPDFALGRSIIQDAYGAARLKPWAVVTAGKYKVPVGLERLISSNDLKFIERGFPSSLVPNRDLGVQLGGELAGGIAQYSIGVFNGVIDGGSSDALGDVDVDDDRDWAARVFFQPFVNSESFALRGLGFGVAATYLDHEGDVSNPLLPTFRTPDQQAFFRYRTDDAATAAIDETVYLDGERVRFTPQAYYYYGSFGLLGEYVRVTQDVSRNTALGLRSDELENSAWQLQMTYFLTGEEATYRGFTPITTLNIGAPGWGAFEIVARYHELDIDDLTFAGGALSYADPDTQARKASAYTLGLNWYFNQNFKWQIDYEHVSFEGGAAGGADREDDQSILTRFAIGF